MARGLRAERDQIDGHRQRDRARDLAAGALQRGRDLDGQPLVDDVNGRRQLVGDRERRARRHAREHLLLAVAHLRYLERLAGLELELELAMQHVVDGLGVGLDGGAQHRGLREAVGAHLRGAYGLLDRARELAGIVARDRGVGGGGGGGRRVGAGAAGPWSLANTARPAAAASTAATSQIGLGPRCAGARGSATASTASASGVGGVSTGIGTLSRLPSGRTMPANAASAPSASRMVWKRRSRFLVMNRSNSMISSPGGRFGDAERRRRPSLRIRWNSDVGVGVVGERPARREHLVEDHAERVDVGAGVDARRAS